MEVTLDWKLTREVDRYTARNERNAAKRQATHDDNDDNLILPFHLLPPKSEYGLFRIHKHLLNSRPSHLGLSVRTCMTDSLLLSIPL